MKANKLVKYFQRFDEAQCDRFIDAIITGTLTADQRTMLVVGCRYHGKWAKPGRPKKETDRKTLRQMTDIINQYPRAQ